MKAKTGILIAAAAGAYFLLGKRDSSSGPIVDPAAEADAQATLDSLLGDWSVLDVEGREVEAGATFPVRFVDGPFRLIFLDPSGNPSVVVRLDVLEAGGGAVVADANDLSPVVRVEIATLGADEITISLRKDGETLTYPARRVAGVTPAQTPPAVSPSAPSRRYGSPTASTRTVSLQDRLVTPAAIPSSRVVTGGKTATSMQATSFSWRDYGPIPDLHLPVPRPWDRGERELLLRAFNNWATEAQRFGIQPGIYREPFMRAFSAGDFFAAQSVFLEATHAEAAFMAGTRGRGMSGTGCPCGCGGSCGCGGNCGCGGPMKGCGCGN